MAPPGESSVDGFKTQTGTAWMRQAGKPWAALVEIHHTQRSKKCITRFSTFHSRPLPTALTM